MSTRNSERLPVGGLVIGLALAGMSAFSLDRATLAQQAWRGLPSPLTRPLPLDLAPVTLLAGFSGQSRIGADWRYIDALQYLGDDKNMDDGFFRRTEGIYGDVLWADPGFRHAVREGASVLGWLLRRSRAAIDLLTRAIAWDTDSSPESKADRDRYRTYLAAMAYAKHHDDARLLETLRAEAQRPDAPEMLLRMLGAVYLRNHDWQGALTYWTWVLGRAKEFDTRHKAKRAIARARSELAKGGR